MSGGARAATAVALLLVAGAIVVARQDRSDEERAGPARAARAAIDPDERARRLVARMTQEEKLQLVHGAAICGRPTTGEPGAERALGGAGFIPGIERLGIPDLNLVDGAVGIANCGARPDGQATVLPSPLARASSWSPALASDAGALLGREARRLGYTALLGGTIDLVRDPRWGRSFESPGEDPLLNGTLLGAETRAVQRQHVIATLKHFALNNQETGRNRHSVVVATRALRELHLLPYEVALREGAAASVMCAYNRIGGRPACQDGALMGEILKGEWGFPGQVESDWGATRSTVRAARAGLDEEQYDARHFGAPLAAAIGAGRVPSTRLDDMVRRKLRGLAAVGLLDTPPPAARPVDTVTAAAVALRLARSSLVLLKNERAALPLPRSIRSVAVVGGRADAGVLSGGGSAQVTPVGGPAVPPTCDIERPGGSRCPVWVPSSPLRAIRAAAPRARVRFLDGTDRRAAARAAASAEVAVVFASEWRREGRDRAALELPLLRAPDWPGRIDQDRLIRAVATANRRTVVVLETGGPVTMPWIGRVAAVVEAWYPGSQGGPAIADMLFGATDPSARLTVTFPRRGADTPTGARPPSRAAVLRYREGLRLGYRWYDARGVRPLFPFGHGLTYTSFGYRGLHVRGDSDALTVRFTLRNRGRRAGTEIAQIYAGFPPAAGEPPRRLVGWSRVVLEAGAERTVTLTIPRSRLAVWDSRAGRWAIRAGGYAIAVGRSSRDLPLRATVNVPGT